MARQHKQNQLEENNGLKWPLTLQVSCCVRAEVPEAVDLRFAAAQHWEDAQGVV
jgi:hypothetical protein